MADETGTIVSENVKANGEDTAPAVGMLNQYIKDLSVENPHAPHSFNWDGAPQIDVQVNIQANAITDEVHEITLKLAVKAESDNGVHFSVELDYGTLFGLRNVTEEQAHPFLFGEAPRLMFPFARRIVADAVRDAGYPPLCLNRLILTRCTSSSWRKPSKWQRRSLPAKPEAGCARCTYEPGS